MARQSHESNSGSLALTHNRYGITEFSEGIPDNCKADIVFVHGLTGNSDSTWRYENAELPWPEEFLARDISDCKILKYDYKISAIGCLDNGALRDLAADLLDELVNWRRDNESERPIIFVAHGLGGLLVKRILPESQSRNAPYNIGALTRGIIFLGTPHRVSELQGNGHRIVKELEKEVKSIVELQAIFQPTSKILDKTHRSFMKWLRERNGNVSKPKVHIASFYEGLPLKREVIGFGDMMVVDIDLAFIEVGYNCLALQCDYKTMATPPVETTESDSGGYCSVRAQLVKAVRLAEPEGELALGDTAGLSENALKDREAFLRSFAFPEVRERFQTVNSHLEGTFKWIKLNETFKSWLELPKMNVFHLAGKRASGKSTFMKYLTGDEALVTWARSQNPSRKTIVISHFFHYAGQDPSRTFEGFLRSILFQLVEADSDAFEQAHPIFRGRTAHQSLPTWPLDDLKKACLEVFKYWGSLVDHQRPITYLVVDAWNHFEGELHEMTSFLQKLFELCGRRLKLCVSSPQEAKIDNALASLASLGVLQRVEIDRHTQQDIEMYIKENYPKLTQITVEDETLVDKIRDHSKGVFLWVRLVCQNLVNCAITSTEVARASPGELQCLLDKLQPDLEEVYEMMFNSIEPDVRGEVEKVLSIVVAASRRLSVEELQCAMHFSNNNNDDDNDDDDDSDNEDDENGDDKYGRAKSKISKKYLTVRKVFDEDFLTVIGTRYRGFLEVTQVTDARAKLIIETCHGTAFTYLTERCKLQGAGGAFDSLVAYGHNLLYKASMAYLSHLSKEDLPQEASEILDLFAEAKDEKQLARLETSNDNNTSSGKWSMTVSPDRPGTADMEEFCLKYPFLSYSAENWGHHAKNGCSAEVEPAEILEKRETFHCFLWVFWEHMEARRANPYSPSDLPLDALEYLSSAGCAGYLYRALARGPDKIKHPERLLLSAIRAKSILMTDRLLRGYSLEKLNINQGEQAVFQAIDFSYNPKWGKRYESLVESLLDHGFPADKKVQYTIRDEHWNTHRKIRVRKRRLECSPLLLAILLRRNSIARLLLRHESCKEAVRQDINWALYRVLELAGDIQPAIKGIKMLLDEGASTRDASLDSNVPERTLLGMALFHKELKVAETLLAHGADANFRCDRASQLSVVAEAENQYPECVPLLLRYGAKVDVWSMEQACQGHTGTKEVPDVISVLMKHLHEKGDIDTLIEGRETALHIAIRYGREDLVERLLQDFGANTSISDHNGDYPVHVALRQRKAMAHIKILQKGSSFDPFVLNQDRRTCFQQAKFKGQYSLARELMNCRMAKDEEDLGDEEDPLENILAVPPYPDPSQTSMATLRVEEPSGSMLVQTRPKDALDGIEKFIRDANAPWNPLRHSEPQEHLVVDPRSRGIEIQLPTQSRVVPYALGNVPLLGGAIMEERAVSSLMKQTYTPSISDVSVEECLAGVGTRSLDEYNAESE
ncbi:DUF676 domain-containing protein [Fusarium keratoplasticum]|nr:DUF676 domain-containing protein [Fusarium keratoplasticum]